MTSNLKIKPEHFDFLKTLITEHDTEFHRRWYKNASFTDKHYRWDLLLYVLHQRNPMSEPIKWVDDVLHTYLSDDEIDCVLGEMVKPLYLS